MTAPINILIVDDEPKNLTVLETILDDPGYRLIRAESADPAFYAGATDEDVHTLVIRKLKERAGAADNETRPMKLGAPPPPPAEPQTTRMRSQSPVAQAEPPTRPFRPRATLPPPTRPGPRPPRR